MESNDEEQAHAGNYGREAHGREGALVTFIDYRVSIQYFISNKLKMETLIIKD